MIRQGKRKSATCRRGATVVEAAIVINIVLLLMFVLLDYGKFLMTVQLLNNAAREGARLATVNTNLMTTAQIQSAVTTYLAGQNLSSQSISVYQADPTTGNNLGVWNNTSMGGSIAVQITGTYTPLLPALSQLPSSINLTATAMMTCEGN